MNWILIALGLSLQNASTFPTDQVSSAGTPSLARLTERYVKVVEELEHGTPPGLSATQAAHRQLVIELLGDYSASQAFPRWPPGTGVRWPLFRDGQGRLCALAHLLDRTGAGALVEKVATVNNGGWLVELQSDPALRDWMLRNGLELSELARIQGPGGMGAPAVDVSGPVPMAPFDPGTGSGGPATGGPAGPSGESGRSSPITGGGNFQPPGSPSGPAGPPTTPNTGGPAVSDWVVWWELNKLDWMIPRTLPTEARDGETTTDPRGLYRARALVVADRGLSSSAAPVRAAAATLGGRLGIAPDKLAACFKDAAPGVRHAGLLGLGLSPRAEGARMLFEVLRDPTKAEQISPLARYYAALGLGLARLHSGPQDIDTLLGSYAGQAQRPQDRLGALAFAQLAPSESLRSAAIAWLRDSKCDQMVRCRAAEALRAFGDPTTLRALQDALGDRQLEVRRSAALALGHVPEPLALQALETACDLEAEQTTRAYLFLSIGRRGGVEAARYLRAALHAEHGALRPFVVLALGIQAGLDNDADSRQALREMQAKSRGADLTQAAALALGLARDPAAIPQLAGLLADSGSEQERHFAALALGLIGGPEASAVLREALPKERAPAAEYALAQALGLQGDPVDTKLLLKALSESTSVELRLQYAAALGMHGAIGDIEGLLNLVEAGKLPPAAQAAALEALGVLLEDGARYRVGALSRSINPSAMPDWQGSLWNFLL